MNPSYIDTLNTHYKDVWDDMTPKKYMCFVLSVSPSPVATQTAFDIYINDYDLSSEFKIYVRDNIPIEVMMERLKREDKAVAYYNEHALTEEQKQERIAKEKQRQANRKLAETFLRVFSPTNDTEITNFTERVGKW